MLVCRDLRALLAVILAVHTFVQSRAQQGKEAAVTPESVPLGKVSSVGVPSVPAESIGAPLLCDSDGRIVFRLATPEAGVEDPVSVSSDGKAVIRDFLVQYQAKALRRQRTTVEGCTTCRQGRQSDQQRDSKTHNHRSERCRRGGALLWSAASW
jgi:hypothetical protein